MRRHQRPQRHLDRVPTGRDRDAHLVRGGLGAQPGDLERDAHLVPVGQPRPLQRHLALLGTDLRHAGRLGREAHAHGGEQPLDRRRDRPVSVAQVGAQRIGVGLGAKPGEASVGLELGARVGDVVVRQVRRSGQVEPHRRRLRQRAAAAQHVDRLGQEPGVHLEPDRGHEAVLLGAEDVAGAADLEVAEARSGSRRRGRRPRRSRAAACGRPATAASRADGAGRRGRGGRIGRPARAAGRAGPARRCRRGR